MQPETDTKTKDNLDPIRENKKKILSEREFSPAEQWDQVAFRLIQQELAPKGYSEMKRGPWRGKVVSNIPFLPKNVVQNCQKISAQLVRAFRGRILKQLTDRMVICEQEQQKAMRLRDTAHFWQFKTKRLEQQAYEHYRDQEGLLHIIINELNNLPIK